MTILLLSTGSWGDVQPFLVIGRALARRGHEVTMATGGHYEAAVRQSGLGFRCVWTREEMDRAFSDPAFWTQDHGPRLAWSRMGAPVMRRSFALINQMCKSQRPTLLASWTAFGGRLANEYLGVPLCTAYQAPGPLESCDTNIARMPPLVTSRVNGIFQPELNQIRHSLGLPSVDDVCARWMHSPQRGITLFPSWFAPRQPYWPSQVISVGFPLVESVNDDDLPMQVSRFLDSGERPIVICALSELRQARQFFEDTADAVLQLRRRAIFLSRFRSQLPVQIHTDILSVDFVPFDRLLPRAAAIVHCGGIGTCAQAMRAGIPQLIMPIAFDQFDNARRLEGLGVALQLAQDQRRVDTLMAMLSKLIGCPDIASHCAQVATLFRGADSVEAICDILESMA